MNRSQSLALGAAGRGVSLLGIAAVGLFLNAKSDFLLIGALVMSGLALVGAAIAGASAWRFLQLDDGALVLTKPAPFGEGAALVAEIAAGPVLGIAAVLASFTMCIGAPIYLAVVAFLTFPAHRWVLVIDPAARTLTTTRFAPFVQTRVPFDQIERIRVGLGLEVYLRGIGQPLVFQKPTTLDKTSVAAAAQPLEVV